MIFSHASEVDGTNPGGATLPNPWPPNGRQKHFLVLVALFWGNRNFWGMSKWHGVFSIFVLGGFGSSYMFESFIHLIPEDGWLNIGDPFPSWGPFLTFQWSTRCKTSEV